jgi:hypothetical protein
VEWKTVNVGSSIVGACPMAAGTLGSLAGELYKLHDRAGDDTTGPRRTAP